MPRLKRLRTNRNAYTWILSFAILTITVFAVQRTLLLQDEQTREDLERNREALQSKIQSWRDLTDGHISSWIRNLPTRNEDALRADIPWFEAVYMWVAASEGPVFKYPPTVSDDSPTAELKTECLIESNGLAKEGDLDSATETLMRCIDDHLGSAQEHLILSTHLANRWLVMKRPDRAWAILDRALPPLRESLNEAPSKNISTKRLVTRRRYAADAEEGNGNQEGAEQIRRELIEDIAALNGPQLKQLLPLAKSFRKQDFGKDSKRSDLVPLDRALTRAAQRLQGYEQLSDYLASRLSSDLGDGGAVEPGKVEIVQGIYAENDYLFFVWALEPNYGGHEGQSFAAVQVQSQALLDSLMDSTLSTPAIAGAVLMDAEGAVLRGDQLSDSGARAQAPLGALFPRLYLVQQIPPTTSSTELGWLAGQLAPVGVAVLLGMIAITGRLRADSKERDLFERQQAFIARVTHELKTPLAGIRVMAETLEMGAAKDEETSKVFLEKIIQEAERLGKRIDEVLTVARKPEVSARTPVAPHELAQEMVDLWTPRYQAVGARLDTDLKACESIAADPALLRDALNNLLDNALKYRRVGIPGRCMVRTGEVGRFVIFEVTDNGIGVPVSMRRRIFERFARVEGAGRGKAGGHGLGLSFAAEAVEAHGGLIECLDGFNGGTRIRLKLRRG